MINRYRQFTAIFLIGIVISSAFASDVRGGRIVNGINANSLHDFTVRINSAENPQAENAYLSTGVAISPTVVVTVAQAIYNYTVWYVFSGGIVWDAQEFQTSHEGVYHPDYNLVNLNNNIGVILLEKALNNYLAINHGSQLGSYQTFGFGLMNDTHFPVTLQTTPITRITNAECIETYGDTFVTDNNFCGTLLVSNAEISHGDQGGPIIPLFIEPMEVAGIISFWGREPNFPIVFERIDSYPDFIGQFV